MPARRPGARRRSRATAAIVVTRTLDEAIALSERHGARAPGRATRDALAAQADARRHGVRRPLQRAGRGDYATGSNHVLPTAGAARGRGGLSAADFVRVVTVQRLTARGLRGLAPDGRRAGAAEGLARARRVDPSPSATADETSHDRRIPGSREPGDGLRLHLNENTAGCSPTVLEALRALHGDAMSRSIPTTTRRRAASRALSRRRSAITSLLTNGLDEGILAAAVAALRRDRAPRRPEADRASRRRSTCTHLTPTPSGRACVAVPLGTGLRVSARRRARRRSRRDTRIVFLTNPNNPTGSLDRRSRRSRRIAARAPPGASSSSTRRTPTSPGRPVDRRAAATLPERPRRPHVLEGVRPGRPARRRAHRASRDARADPARRAAVQPQRLAAAALPAALDDRRLPASGTWRRRSESQELLYARLRPARAATTGRARPTSCWSDVGDRARRARRRALAARGMYVRDRSTDPAAPAASG